MNFSAFKFLAVFLPLLILGCQSNPIKTNSAVGTAISAHDAATLSAEELNALVGPILPDGTLAPFNPLCEREQRIYFLTANLPSISTAVELNKLLVRGLAPIYIDPHQAPNFSPCVRNPYWIAPNNK